MHPPQRAWIVASPGHQSAPPIGLTGVGRARGLHIRIILARFIAQREPGNAGHDSEREEKVPMAACLGEAACLR